MYLPLCATIGQVCFSAFWQQWKLNPESSLQLPQLPTGIIITPEIHMLWHALSLPYFMYSLFHLDENLSFWKKNYRVLSLPLSGNTEICDSNSARQLSISGTYQWDVILIRISFLGWIDPLLVFEYPSWIVVLHYVLVDLILWVQLLTFSWSFWQKLWQMIG